MQSNGKNDGLCATGGSDRNETSDQETQRFYASAFQHVASVGPVERTTLQVQQEVPSSDFQASGEVVQEELPRKENESSDKTSDQDTQRFHASAFQHVASVGPVERTILQVQQEVPSSDVQPSGEVVQEELPRDQDTQRFHASAFQHVASVGPVERTILQVQQEVPSSDVQPSGEVVQEELPRKRNESSDKDTQWFHASAFQHVASVEPVEQSILEVKQEIASKNVQEKVAGALISGEAAAQDKDEVQGILENPASDNARYVPVEIPEMDPENDFCSLPIWMLYDPSKKVIAHRYTCRYCICVVPRSDAEEHATGKKHRKMCVKFASRSHASYDSLSTHMDNNYGREFQLFTNENLLRMAECLQSLTLTEGNPISVGFTIDFGHLVCLSLVTKTICLNIDRTILIQADILRSMVEFREIFEGSCIVGGGNMWELMLVLYHRYGIRSNAVADLDDFATDDAGTEVSLSNSKLHHESATRAVQCYACVNVSKTKLLTILLTNEKMLKHVCLLNEQMYSIYREVRENHLMVNFSRCIFNKDGTRCRVTCTDYNSRIRTNTLVRLQFSDHMLYGKCLEWDCARTGKEAEVVLRTPNTGCNVKKIFVNRRKEMLMRRVLLRGYILKLASAEITTNVYQDHMYLVKPIPMKFEDEKVFKKTTQPSENLNQLQNYGLLRSKFPISVIHGPPGTGKTRVLSVICQDAVRQGQGVLCLCWTNVALRRLCEDIVRLVPFGVARIVTSKEYGCWHEAECKSLKHFEAKDYECEVLCMTVANYLYRSQQGDSVNKWSVDLLKQREVLLLDEASQLWELEEAMLLSCMSAYKRVVNFGDQKQLRPRVLKKVQDSPSLLTWIENLPERYMVPATRLKRQYRMMPSVGRVVSDNFYEGTLVHHKAADKKPHLFFHCVEGKLDDRHTSKFCVEDSRKCIEIFKRYPTHLKIQVLTFYKAQCDHVKSLDHNINVCCIDSFQGQQADIVILLLSVRNCNLSPFMVDKGRLCVATSRARMNLHIVGDWRTMMQNGTWRNIIGGFNKVYK